MTPEDFADFAASPPPRRIPPAIRAARLPAGPLVIALAVALLLFAATAAIVGAVFPDRLIDDLRIALATSAHAEGRVIAVEDSGRSVVTYDGGRNVDRPILRLRFRFVPDGGIEREGASYSTGVEPDVGSAVVVEYLPAHPELARIVGGTLSSTPLIAALVLLLPAIALAWLWRVTRRRRGVRGLLVNGQFALASVAATRPRRVFIGHGRLEATLHLLDGRNVSLDVDDRGAEAAALRAAEADQRPIAVLVDPARTDRLLIASAFVERSADEEGDDDDDDDDGQVGGSGR